MMRNSLFLLLLVLVFACKKDDEQIAKNQNAIGNYLFANKDLKIEQLNSAGAHSMGYQFSAAKQGKINQIGIFSAEIGMYKIYIYDSTAKSVIFEDTIYQRSLENWRFRDVEFPIKIETRKKYFIYTRNLSQKKFNAVKKNSSEFPANSKLDLPLKVENITIESLVFSYSGGVPAKDTTTAFYGLVDFTFREDR